MHEGVTPLPGRYLASCRIVFADVYAVFLSAGFVSAFNADQAAYLS
jgi:hypothetical protein